MVPGLVGPGYEDRLKILQLPSFKIKREWEDLIMIYKIMSGKKDLDKDQFFKIGMERTKGK